MRLLPIVTKCPAGACAVSSIDDVSFSVLGYKFSAENTYTLNQMLQYIEFAVCI